MPDENAKNSGTVGVKPHGIDDLIDILLELPNPGEAGGLPSGREIIRQHLGNIRSFALSFGERTAGPAKFLPVTGLEKLVLGFQAGQTGLSRRLSHDLVNKLGEAQPI
jgi:hypothetical protein